MPSPFDFALLVLIVALGSALAIIARATERRCQTLEQEQLLLASRNTKLEMTTTDLHNQVNALKPLDIQCAAHVTDVTTDYIHLMFANIHHPPRNGTPAQPFIVRLPRPKGLPFKVGQPINFHLQLLHRN